MHVTRQVYATTSADGSDAAERVPGADLRSGRLSSPTSASEIYSG